MNCVACRELLDQNNNKIVEERKESQLVEKQFLGLVYSQLNLIFLYIKGCIFKYVYMCVFFLTRVMKWGEIGEERGRGSKPARAVNPE